MADYVSQLEIGLETQTFFELSAFYDPFNGNFCFVPRVYIIQIQNF